MKRLCLFLCSLMILSTCTVFADSNRFVTIGEDLNDEQRGTVLQFFGLSDNDLNTIQVVSVSNEEEREYLSGIVDDSVIGTHTYSCAYIEPTSEGGIQVKTANLTYVTSDVLVNALQTAGIENCNVIVTAPFEVSGTGALTGIYKGYEQQGVSLDEAKKKLASEELIITAKAEEECGKEVANLITDVKKEVINADKALTDEEIWDIVQKKSIEYNININSSTLDKIVDLVSKFQGMDYDADTFTNKLDEIRDKVTKQAEESEGFFEGVKRFFKAIGDFFKNLFGGKEVEEDTNTSIFDDINTNIFEYDDVEENEGTTEGDTEEAETQEKDASEEDFKKMNDFLTSFGSRFYD